MARIQAHTEAYIRIVSRHIKYYNIPRLDLLEYPL